MTTVPDDPSLAALIDAVRSAIDRASVSKKEADEHRVFAQMRDEISAHPERFSPIRFCIEADRVELEESERVMIESAVMAASDAVTVLRGQLRRAPTQVRSGPAWKACKQNLVALQAVGNEVREVALERLLQSQPRPKPGITALLAPDDARTTEYQRLRDRYAELRAMVDSPEDLRALLNVSARLEALGDEIQQSAVPSAYRDQWGKLLSVVSRLADLDPAFIPGYATLDTTCELVSRIVERFRG